MRKICLMISIMLCAPAFAYGDSASMLYASHSKAAEQVVAAWMTGDDAGLRDGLGRIARYETYLLVEDKLTPADALISRVPAAVTGGSPRRIAAHIWLYRLQKNGMDLTPSGIFAGKTYQSYEKE